MNRLTEQEILTNDYTYSCSINEFEYGNGKQEVLNKLGKLEDLEEQLGCPLEVIHKALKDGIFCENEKGYVINLRVYLQFVEANAKYSLLDFNYYFILPLEDYKKTWWLKEDRSE